MSKPQSLKEILEGINKYLDELQAVNEPFTQEERENVIEIQNRIFNVLDTKGSQSA